ncbi:MAG: hypothetical protein QOI31_3187 [Solirubrobacterales bacterium]|nr:hypothetical protein [Solirubrobacterales bacterium]
MPNLWLTGSVRGQRGLASRLGLSGIVVLVISFGLVSLSSQAVAGPPPLPGCADGVDNDGDGFTDAGDFDCSEGQQGEYDPTCKDGEDNDNDGFADLEDSDCANGGPEPESAECIQARADLAAAEANLETAEEKLKSAKKRLKNAKESGKENKIKRAKAAVKKAKAALAVAQNDVVIAEGDVELACEGGP